MNGCGIGFPVETMRVPRHGESRLALAVASAFVALAPTTAAGAGTIVGPFVGVATPDSTDSYTYDNDPLDWPCIQIARTYTLTLGHAPATDALRLLVGVEFVDSSGGFAQLEIVRGVCTRFTVVVEGVSVAVASAYTVTVV